MSFAVTFIALYVAHHVGDYWVQTDRQARLKGTAGEHGSLYCLQHVLSYVGTQLVFLLVTSFALGEASTKVSSFFATNAAMVISGVAHYAADRREFGILPKLAKLIPGKQAFYSLGAPRGGHYDDPPQLATGAWALDQSWHILTSVFVPALIIGAFS